MTGFLAFVAVAALLMLYLEVKYRAQQHENDSQELQGSDDDVS